MQRADDELRVLLAAVQYFTRLPVPRRGEYRDSDLDDVVRYFPLIGVLVGGMTGVVFLLASHVLTHALAVLLAMLAGVLLTGGLHEDGLADVCDGFGGGWDKAQILAIMKDSRIGSFGALGLGFAAALKFSALAALPVAQFLGIAVAAHAYSRFMAVTVIATQRYAREDETARARRAAQNVSRIGLACAALVALAPLPWLGAAGVAGALGAFVLRLSVARYFYRRIGGYTGDCLGAIQQITEVGFYLAVLAWISI